MLRKHIGIEIVDEIRGGREGSIECRVPSITRGGGAVAAFLDDFDDDAGNENENSHT